VRQGGEPKGIEREPSQILPKVFRALRDEGMSRADVARELRVPVEELNRAVFGLTVATEADAGGEVPRPERPAGGRPDLACRLTERSMETERSLLVATRFRP
jgi:hypothetical protein